MAKGLTGLILAGGQSRRMGRDKAFLPWGRSTLIEHIIECLRPIADDLIVVVKEAHRFRHLRATVIEDLVPDAHAPLEKRFLTGHALGGLYTGLRAARFARCFVCGCDAPFLNPTLIRFLADQAAGVDLVIPRTAHGFQPLHAVYAPSALSAIQEQLRRRQWDLRALVPRVRAKCIGPEVIHRWDPEELSFVNINTPDDLARATGLLQAGAARDVFDGRLTRVMESWTERRYTPSITGRPR